MLRVVEVEVEESDEKMKFESDDYSRLHANVTHSLAIKLRWQNELERGERKADGRTGEVVDRLKTRTSDEGGRSEVRTALGRRTADSPLQVAKQLREPFQLKLVWVVETLQKASLDFYFVVDSPDVDLKGLRTVVLENNVRHPPRQVLCWPSLSLRPALSLTAPAPVRSTSAPTAQLRRTVQARCSCSCSYFLAATMRLLRLHNHNN
ncbi:hypothetical protein BGZ60DRAFT_510409 [Tricladium varicosporioides]|nr:hypothetical protein BGZ60DRAFT_510409 [Hymenoscyphus varicosporioides]